MTMTGTLFQVTAPASEPLDLDDVKLHLRVALDQTDEDELIVSLMQAARETAETYTHRAIPVQTWDEKFDGFPGYELWLSKPPVTSVTSVTYLDTAGTSTVWAAANYRTDLPSGPWARRARIVPAFGVVYPSTYGVPAAVTVRFVCGYTTAPEAIKAAMKLLIGHWYKEREVVNVGNITSVIPFTVESLLWPYKAF